MTDLERLFRMVVTRLLAQDPARLSIPFPVRELTGDLVPYREARPALGLDCSEDYEMLVLRLCAGVEQLAQVVDHDTLALFERQIQSTHPDLDVLAANGQAEVALYPPAVARALGSEPIESYAPEPADDPADADLDRHAEPEPPAVPTAPPVDPPIEEREGMEVPHAAATEAPAPEARCVFCGGELPADRAVKFCPHCGQSQTELQCPGCGSELELGWRHCIACGRAAPEP